MNKKSLFFFLVALVLFESCTIVNRKYMPGYSIDWRSSKKPIAETKEIQFVNSLESSKISFVVKSEARDIDMKLVKQYQFDISSNKKVSLKPVIQYNLSATPYLNGVIHGTIPADTVKHQQKDLPEHPQATKSLTYGVLSILIPVAALFIGIAINASLLFSYGLVLIIAAILALSFAFSIVSLIAGGKAIRAIKKEPDKYSGIGDAIAGIVLSLLIPLAILMLIIISASNVPLTI